MSTARSRFLYAGKVKCTAFGRLSLREGEGEGLSRAAVVYALQRLTSVPLSFARGEAAKDLVRTKLVASLASL